MRFKVDQNLPVEVAEALRGAGHDAATVYEQQLAGVPDPQLGAIIQREARGLITLDTGFGDIRTYPPHDYQGLVVLRPPSQDKPTVLRLFAAVVSLLEYEPLIGRLWMVEEHRIRTRS